ncbi:MAG: tryptophan synthase subunit alpha [Cyanobacteria bacterium P01_A01_bin.84]
MSAISQRFETLSHKSQCALIPFITAGDPDLETTAKALQVLDNNGADIIELGVPYSDPLADGPVIQAAATRALEKGTTLEQVLKMLVTTIPQLKAPIVLFAYYNLILHRGTENFLDRVAAVGISGLVVPDLPLEEATSLLERAAQRNIDLILLIAPTSSPERMQSIAERSGGFIYLVSVTGVTGVRSQIELRVSDLISHIRSITNKPIGVGFGISGPEQASQIKQWGANAVIVGSAFVKRLAEGSPEEALKKVGDFCQTLKSAIN